MGKPKLIKMLEKIFLFPSFPNSSIPKYRERNFKKYNDLTTILDMTKNHNELLLKNSERCHVIAQVFLKVNANYNKTHEHECGRGYGHGNYYENGRGNDGENGRGYGGG